MIIKLIIQKKKMEDCIFCKIVKGEIPCQKVYEDEKVLAFNDINPLAPIHVLVVPKQHFDNVMEVSEDRLDVITDIFKAINKIVKQLGIEEKGFRVVTNCGQDAGQAVMHLHFHILAGKDLGEEIMKIKNSK